MKSARTSSIALIRLAFSRTRGAPPPHKRPPKGSAAALVEPPRGPLPLTGGAQAPLEFSADTPLI